MLSKLVTQKFQELFNEKPLLVRSPGRVNLIGEHTDYNEGFVLPAAIDKAIYFAISPRDDEKCSLFALDMNESFEFAVCSLLFTEKHWPNYLMGVVDQLNKFGHKLKGFNCVFGGDIPIGAGMSSSAAIEAGLAFALNHIFNLGIDKLTLVKLAQKAENEFVGVKCGIMDQYINIFGKYGNVLRIDCRSLEYDYFPFEYKEISIVLFDTGVSHSLASSEYNQRRKECTLGVELIKKDHSHIKSLRDVTLAMLNDYKNKLDSKIFQRCKYVVEENDRMMKACESLNQNDLKSFGELMFKTHEGLRDDYEVSCKELDYLVELTIENPGIYGSRMMGGGFGGCTINLIENNIVEETKEIISKKYKQKFNINLKTYITSISNGTSVFERQ
ncbi:MAG: galactokinase [Ignavibacteriales bacterium]|nr:galactokinase [Ignavibacteriales bacterium]